MELSADDIMRAAPGDVFTPNEAAIKARYHELVRVWHPDVSSDPRAEDVFKRLGALKVEAEAQLVSGHWSGSRDIVVTADGKKYRMAYVAKRDNDAGTAYIGKQSMLYVLPKARDSLFDVGVSRMRALTYASEDMRNNVVASLPTVKRVLKNDEFSYVLLEKSPNEIRLSDLLSHMGGKIDPKHVAWIGSRLLNITCYLEWAGLTHNDISADSVYVSPKNHGAHLLGGWWYSGPVGDSMVGLTVPARSAGLVGPKQRREKRFDYALDQDCVRALIRELLGDVFGSTLAKTAPPAMASWATSTATKSAVDSFTTWRSALEASFGPPKFVKMETTFDNVYGERK